MEKDFEPLKARLRIICDRLDEDEQQYFRPLIDNFNGQTQQFQRIMRDLGKFGEKIGREGGIVKLMKDLGEALTENQEMRMMGGGNPAAIPEVQSIWRKQIQSILSEPEHLNAILGDYDGPSGNPIFLNALAILFLLVTSQ